MRIGAVAEAAGVNIATVRYYERRGIVPEPTRSSSGYRRYHPSVIQRIRFIKRAQGLGFTLSEIEGLLGLKVHDPAACGQVAGATREKIEGVEEKIRDLNRLQRILRDLLRACEQNEETTECPVLALLDELEEEQV